MTWRAALRRMRILRAIELLAAGKESITRIALDVGYSSPSAFQAAFRDLTGKSPIRVPRRLQRLDLRLASNERGATAVATCGSCVSSAHGLRQSRSRTRQAASPAQLGIGRSRAPRRQAQRASRTRALRRDTSRRHNGQR